MAGTSAASPRTQTLTVALDLPSAQVLADQIATIQDLQFVMECCKRLLTELVTPEDERDPVVPQALWSAALTGYGRCFSKGTKFGLAADDVRSLPLEGQVLKFHTWIVDERNKLARHAADPFELAKVGTVLSAPGLSAPGLSGGQPDGGEAPGRQLEGITVLSASHILVDGPACGSWAPWRPSWPSRPPARPGSRNAPSWATRAGSAWTRCTRCRRCRSARPTPATPPQTLGPNPPTRLWADFLGHMAASVFKLAVSGVSRVLAGVVEVCWHGVPVFRAAPPPAHHQYP